MAGSTATNQGGQEIKDKILDQSTFKREFEDK